ncbi:HAD family phosphatase [Roseicyclus sp. F158]|uniref:HAD family phosphatase n=1 Tax=Tropicimonas omnivorans TaxID=3075590 RepID=A0ABU3DBI9_9RHOB|nr:HAD family phosphatase [Roseicyclus sp. F158]MDT0681084.1 HAD family phosphatase [Roseicyclus sp. F158]
MSVEAVVFDIGNVLIEWQPERWYDARIGEARRREMFAAVDLHGMNDTVDRGGAFRDTVHTTAARYPDWSAEILMWHDNWLELAAPAIDATVDILRKLRSNGTPVFALSNFGVETFAIAEAEYPFLQEFDRRYISGHMRLAKPDAAIYAEVEADCGVSPSALLFADDRPDNIEAAALRGWQTHLFDGPEGWVARLRAEGLL